MLVCKKCKKEIDEKMIFCPHCGEKVVESDAEKALRIAAVAGTAGAVLPGTGGEPTGDPELVALKAQAMATLKALGEQVTGLTVKSPDIKTPAGTITTELVTPPVGAAGVTAGVVTADGVTVFDEPRKAPAYIPKDVLKPSRGYSFLRLAKALRSGDWSDAIIELEMSKWLKVHGYGDDALGVLVPINSRGLNFDFDTCKQVHDVMTKDVYHDLKAVHRKAMSEGDASAGGFLVEPEHSAELIELLRAQAVVSLAGAREYPLGRSGQATLGKITGGTTGYWIGEAGAITESQLTTGQLVLIAKKCAGLVKLSNELIADSTPDAERIVREDMAQQIALTEDLAFMQGVGSSLTPKGVVNHAGVTSVADSGGNGSIPTADDFSQLMVECEVNNGNPSAFISHPRIKHIVRKLQDGAGNYIYEPTTAKEPATLWGIRMFWTSQLPVNLIVGSGTNCTRILCGMWSEALIARRAVVEISMTDVGDTAFVNDQTWLKAVSRVDFGLRTENVFSHKSDSKIA